MVNWQKSSHLALIWARLPVGVYVLHVCMHVCIHVCKYACMLVHMLFGPLSLALVRALALSLPPALIHSIPIPLCCPLSIKNAYSIYICFYMTYVLIHGNTRRPASLRPSLWRPRARRHRAAARRIESAPDLSPPCTPSPSHLLLSFSSFLPALASLCAVCSKKSDDTSS